MTKCFFQILGPNVVIGPVSPYTHPCTEDVKYPHLVLRSRPPKANTNELYTCFTRSNVDNGTPTLASHHSTRVYGISRLQKVQKTHFQSDGVRARNVRSEWSRSSMTRMGSVQRWANRVRGSDQCLGPVWTIFTKKNVLLKNGSFFRVKNWHLTTLIDRVILLLVACCVRKVCRACCHQVRYGALGLSIKT